MTMIINTYQFKTAELVYMGCKLAANGVESDEEKICIMGLPEPKDKKGVQQLVGLVNYLDNFIPNISEMTVLLRDLLVKNVSWYWGNE